MIGIIAAVTMNGVIGVDGKIPFDYPEDMAHFKQTTLDSVVIMGRKTFEGIGRPLPKRENIVITSQKMDVPGIKTYSSLANAISMQQLVFRDHHQDIWLIGGAKIYEEGLLHADKILLTITPGYEFSERAVRFPWINPKTFELGEVKELRVKNAIVPTDHLFIYEYNRRSFTHDKYFHNKKLS